MHPLAHFAPLVLLTATLGVAQTGPAPQDFEAFTLGAGQGQAGWTSSVSAPFQVIDSGVLGFGARTLALSVGGATPFAEVQGPATPGCTDCALFLDVLVTNDANDVELVPWDLGKGIQNTIVTLHTDGSITAFQLSPFGQFTGVYYPTTGSWSPGVTTRIGVQLQPTSPSLRVYQDGVVIFEGTDMARAYPFGSGPTGMGQLRLRRSASSFGAAGRLLVDNLSREGGRASVSTCIAGPTGAVASAAGSFVPGVNTLELVATGLPSTFGLFFAGSEPAVVPVGGGTRCVGGTVFRASVAGLPDPSGTRRVALDLATAPGNTILAGTSWHFQYAFRSTATPAGYEFSSAVRVDLGL